MVKPSGLNHNKDLGQHFLVDRGVLGFISQAIAPETQSHIIEIGAGSGQLTDELISCPDIDLVELDKRWVRYLQDKFLAQNKATNVIEQEKEEEIKKIKIHACDAMQFDFKNHIRTDKGKTAIVGNLPYNISSQIILKILQLEITIAPSVYLIQKELAQRITAQAGSSYYGRLTAMVQFFAQAEYLLDVPPSAFDPPPKVDSAVIKITQLPTETRIGIDRIKYTHIVKLSFAHKRKQLHNNLKSFVSKEQIKNLFGRDNIRAEDMSVEDFVLLLDKIEEK